VKILWLVEGPSGWFHHKIEIANRETVLLEHKAFITLELELHPSGERQNSDTLSPFYRIRVFSECFYTLRKGSSEAIFTAELDEQLRSYYLAEGDTRQKERLRDQIIQQVMPYVKKIAHGLARRSTDPVDDLMQVGNIGLMKAVEKYNPFSGSSFKTYATYLITGEIRHYLRDKTAMIKAPRQIYELYYRINLIVQRLTEDLGRPPTDVEIAEELQCPVRKVEQAQELDRRRQPVSLDQFMSPSSESGNETVYMERLVDEKYLEFLHNRENNLFLERALQKLKPELRDVVQMSYFDDMSQSEIAEQLGISQMQVSRRLRKALDILSQALQGDMADVRQR
jgi:RNA polymerase sigma-B factor